MILIKDGIEGSAEMLSGCSCMCMGGYPYAEIATTAFQLGPRCGCGCGDWTFTDMARALADYANPQ